MTEKIARRGYRIVGEYMADWLEQVNVATCCARDVVTLKTSQPIETTKAWLRSEAEGSDHKGFPVLDSSGRLAGVLTRRDFGTVPGDAEHLRDLIRRPPAVVHEHDSVRAAADHMIAEGVGRLPVLSEEGQLVGMLTRSDILRAHEQRLTSAHRAAIARPVHMPRGITWLRERIHPRDDADDRR